MGKKLHKFIPIILSLTSGLLLFLSWYPNGFIYLVFFALVPILILSEIKHLSPLMLFSQAFAGFFMFHILAAGWMYSSTFAGSIFAHIFNSAYMALVVYFWSAGKKVLTSKIMQSVMLISFWVMFETIHHHWELAWPWFTLGHVFAEKTEWIQWYSYTGSLGGSVWVLSTNLFFYFAVVAFRNNKNKRGVVLIMSAFLIGGFLILLSQKMKTLSTYDRSLHVLVIQPNIHPQKEKFAGMSVEDQIERATILIKKGVTEKTDLIILPETMLVEPIDENLLSSSKWIEMLRSAISNNSSTAIFTGAFTKKISDWAITDQMALINDSIPYVLYNSALLIQKDSIQIYHKTQLVTLVEKQPFYALMKPFKSFIERSGGIFGRYGTYNTSNNLQLNDKTILAPLICFESAFGDYTADQVSNGSELIVLITNDGWWSSFGGYKQHLALARLRAIETGRWIARCANTGISAIIDSKGNIVKQSDYGEAAYIESTVGLNSKNTFYVNRGNLIGPFAVAATGLLSILLILKQRRIRKNIFKRK
ncbi:MAG: apolipoprotein N-acyltransferase [Bacteroidetes bacterium HGW-Bacteroidetes-1]|nr:MAG: apolipoprotein N-acyltransferase [Bacteroidetes bacterium HGW-Bacteroidetes-1]